MATDAETANATGATHPKTASAVANAWLTLFVASAQRLKSVNAMAMAVGTKKEAVFVARASEWSWFIEEIATHR